MKKTALLGSALLLSAIASAQLQNLSFETWENPIGTTTGGNRPVGWIRTNGVPGSELISFKHDPVSAAQHGNYALRLSIWYTYDKDMAVQTAPINYRPAALTGFYTYTQNTVYDPMVDTLIDDIASVTVRLTKTDLVSGEVTLIGNGLLQLNAASAYEPFTCSIEYTSEEIPDQIEVVLDCSLMKRGAEGSNGITAPSLAGSVAGWASFFTVDNLALTTETLTVNEVTATDIGFFPNPARDVLHLPGFEGEALIYGLSGQLLRRARLTGGQLDIRDLPNGTYLLSLLQGDLRIHKHFIKQ